MFVIVLALAFGGHMKHIYDVLGVQVVFVTPIIVLDFLAFNSYGMIHNNNSTMIL